MPIEIPSRAFQRKRHGSWYPALRLSWYRDGFFYEKHLEWDRTFPTEQEARQYADQWLSARMA